MSLDKSWQARIAEATDAATADFVESITYDHRLAPHDVEGSIAHARMLADVGLLSAAELSAIETGLAGIAIDLVAGKIKLDPRLEDIHMVIEAELIKRIGEPGRKLHTGRSRNDQVALDLRLWIDFAAGQTADKLELLCSAFDSVAEKSRDVIMPAFTHLQRAQPISAAAECLAWRTMFENDIARLAPLAKVNQRSPLGSGAIAGSSLPLNVAHTAASLGFAAGPASSIYETSSRDLAVDYLFALAMASMHLSRLAEQWIIYMTTEFGFINIADRFTTGSSMMPQKRNPDTLELIRGRCGNVYGDLFGLMTILKGLPLGYNRDLQEDKRLLFRAHDTLASCLTMAAAVVSSATFNGSKITPTLDRGFLDATSLAEYLVGKGVPFRTAHQVVGTLVARCEDRKLNSLGQLSLEEIVAAVDERDSSHSNAIGPDVYESLGAANVVARYRSGGAAGGAPLAVALASKTKATEP